MSIKKTLQSLLLVSGLISPLAHAEILAMLNYESKPNVTPRREGIAIIDVDPSSATFRNMLVDIPLPPDLVAHHFFYNRDASKAYLTALGSNPLQVMDMKQFPYRLKTVAVPDCQVAEDLAFSKDGKFWYLTCMGSSNVIVGDAQSDAALKTVAAPEAGGNGAFISYPHGIGLQDDIDRIVVTSTVRPADLGGAGETVAVLQASTGKVLSTHKLSDKPSPSGVAPVEAVFLPGANPATVYVNTMFGGMLWAGVWDKQDDSFKFHQLYDFSLIKQGVPLEIYFNHKHDRLFVTTANPGALNVFDISKPTQPKLLKSIPTAGGAHHVVFSPDEHYAFVQNSFLNLPDMNDGSITVVDLVKMEKKTSVDTLKNLGLNPNSIVMLPEWHHDDAH